MDTERESLTQVVAQFFAEHELVVTQRPDDDGAVFICPMSVPFGKLDVVVTTHEAADRVVVNAIAPLNAPEAVRPAVAELITRCNAHTLVGAVVMDFDSGTVLFRAGVDVEDDRLSVPLVKNLFAAALCGLLGIFPQLLQLFVATSAPQPAAVATPLNGQGVGQPAAPRALGFRLN